MRSTMLSLMSCIIVLCVLAQAALQSGQSSTTEQTPAGVKKTATGQQSVTGCVAREGDAFVLKTDEGTYQFNTARDLSPYVGKKVRIAGRWNATGVTTTAPIKATSSSTAQQESAGKSATPIKGFVGDLHLHITGDVIGDCAQPK